MSEQRDRAQLDDVAGSDFAPEQLAEIVGKRDFGMIGRNLQTIDLGQRAERRCRRNKKIAKQPRIG